MENRTSEYVRRMDCRSDRAGAEGVIVTFTTLAKPGAALEDELEFVADPSALIEDRFFFRRGPRDTPTGSTGG